MCVMGRPDDGFAFATGEHSVEHHLVTIVNPECDKSVQGVRSRIPRTRPNRLSVVLSAPEPHNGARPRSIFNVHNSAY